MLWILVLGAILIWAPSPTITHRSSAERGHTQIKPKPCSVNGIEGTCMFVYECIKTEGKHVGMCVDNFMFGSCCSHNITQNTIINPSHPNVLYSQNNVNSSPRLSVIPVDISSGKFRAYYAVNGGYQFPLWASSQDRTISDEGTVVSNERSSLSPGKDLGKRCSYFCHFRPSSFSINSRPASQQSSSSSSSSSSSINSKVRPSKPIGFITRTTKRPPTTTHRLKDTPTTETAITIGKPWTNKPPHFVTSAARPSKYPYPNTYNATSVVTQSLLIVPLNSSLYGNSPPPTSLSYPSVYDLIATSKPTQHPNSTTTKTTLVITNNTKISGTEGSESNTIPSWSTSKPLWSGSSSVNDIITSSNPFPHHSKPEHGSSGKPGKPWQASTEAIFVTRPRPSSNVAHRPKPTRRPVTLITGAVSKTTTTSTSTTSTTSTTTTTTTAAPPEEVTASESTTTSTTTSLVPEGSKYQYSGQCGVAALSPRPEMRIVGGKNAPFGGWPWQVSVRRTSFFGFSSTHRCGGAVINENWIATAGHCVDDLLTSQIRIRVGEYDFSSVMEPYPFVERAVSKKVVHPKYNFFTYEYDLALVRLDSPLEFQPHISPICLPASDDLLIGENATVTGWGRLSEGGTLPSVLQQVSVPIVSNDKCKSMFLRAGRHEFIPEIFLCAGYENGGQDSCQGDSGGPLQVKGKNGRYFLAGIISWGIGCAEANLPGVCTRISKFVPWILENVT